MIFQSGEQRVVIQPSGLLFFELTEAVAHGRLNVFLRGRARLDLQKTGICLFQKAYLEFNDRSVVHLFRIPLRLVLKVLVGEKSRLLQILRADDVDLPGKGRQTLIGRISEPGRSQGEHLPQMLVGILQKIDKITCALPQVANPVRGGE